MRRATVKKDEALVKVDPKVVSKVVTKVPTFDITKISFELKCKNESQKNLVNLINNVKNKILSWCHIICKFHSFIFILSRSFLASR